MLFWFTLIQALPTVAEPEAAASDVVQRFGREEGTAIPLARAEIPFAGGVGQIGGTVVFPAAIVGVVVLLLLSIWGYTRVYVITPTNEAFVRTGGVFRKRKTVVLNGGCVVLPGFHELTRVPLRELSIDVERTGKLAVRTQDYLRADMRVTFYVCINASEDAVLTAAARLSSQGRITPEHIKNALEKRADDAIRAAAKKKPLREIDSDKLGFAQEVLNLIEEDLRRVGLTLNNIAISEIEEGNTYDTDNYFDAQGVELRTVTIEESIKKKEEVELLSAEARQDQRLKNRVAIEEKEADARRESRLIARQDEEDRLKQDFDVQSLQAQREREVAEAKARETAAAERTKIQQERLIEEEEINRRLGVQQKQIEANIQLEEQQKQFSVAQAQQQQQAQIAEVSRRKAVESAQFKAQVELAEAERESRVAEEDVAVALAQKEQERFEALAKRAQAEAAVETATAVEEAQRQQQLSAIAAQREAEERRIADQNVVEIDVFRRRRQAEVARQAAEQEAEAIRTLAAAERDKALAEAEGIEARTLARNAISNANLTADVIIQLWPELAERLPEVLHALAPQPGVIGDARIYAFPGANGNGSAGQDISKLMLSTSGLSLINTLLEDGKLGDLVQQMGQMVRGSGHEGATTDASASNPVLDGD